MIPCCRRQEKFDKVKWKEMGDLMTFPNRKYMTNDLVKNYQLVGKSYKDIVELLDEPQSKLDSTLETFYDIDINWGTIDPTYVKTLNLKFSKDSIVERFEVKEWRK